MNIAFISSKGGHLGQIKLLFTNEIIGQNNAILITETEKSNLKTIDKNFNNKFRTYLFKKDILLFPEPIRYIKTLFRLIRILKNEEIDLIITNGAQISIPAIIAAKILKIKSIFLETVIRVKTTTWTAKFCYNFADIFLVQHKEMIKKYGKKAKYFGGII